MPIIKKRIDPTKLSELKEEDRALLHTVFAIEEKNNTRKAYEPNKPYLILDRTNGQGYFITFSHKLARRKKRNKKIIVLGPDEMIPPIKDKSTLYIKSNPKTGTAFVQTSNDEHPKEISAEQVSQLPFGLDQPLKIVGSTAENRKKISVATQSSGYEKTYVYSVIDTQNKVAEGSFGKIYEVPGKLEHSHNEMKYIDYQSARVPEEKNRGSRKPKIAKIQHQRLDAVRTENELWQRDESSQTKKSTRVKGSDGSVVEDIMIQRKFEGIELGKILEEKNLTFEQRMDITNKLLEELKKLHAMGIIHRDIKPQNILVNLLADPITVKIIDFGIAQDIASTQSEMIGSAFYMAPENLSGQSPDQQNDIYAMGIVLRKLWGDESIKQREEKIFMDSNREMRYAYPNLEYLFNIPMVSTHIPESILADFDNDSAKEILRVLVTMLDGMTMPRPSERMSIKTASEVFNGQLALPLEQKLQEEIMPTKTNYDTAFNCINELRTFSLLHFSNQGIQCFDRLLQLLPEDKRDLTVLLPHLHQELEQFNQFKENPLIYFRQSEEVVKDNMKIMLKLIHAISNIIYSPSQSRLLEDNMRMKKEVDTKIEAALQGVDSFIVKLKDEQDEFKSFVSEIGSRIDQLKKMPLGINKEAAVKDCLELFRNRLKYYGFELDENDQTACVQCVAVNYVTDLAGHDILKPEDRENLDLILDEKSGEIQFLFDDIQKLNQFYIYLDQNALSEEVVQEADIKPTEVAHPTISTTSAAIAALAHATHRDTQEVAKEIITSNQGFSVPSTQPGILHKESDTQGLAVNQDQRGPHLKISK